MLANKKEINSENVKPIYYLHESSKNLVGALNSITEGGGRYVLLGEYINLPHFFNGNDIDVLVSDVNLAAKEFKKHGFLLRRKSKHELRAFIYVTTSKSWISVDVETIYSYSFQEASLLIKILDNPVKNGNNGLLTIPKNHLTAYKTMKYIFNGYVHSQYQIHSLCMSWLELTKSEKKYALGLLRNLDLGDKFSNFVDIIASHKEGGVLDSGLLGFVDKKRNNRHLKRLVYQGSMNFRFILTRPKLIFSLIYGRFVKSKYAFPAVALVGNDGSGKTEQCQRIKDQLYKLEPLHIVMRGNEAWLPGWCNIRNAILSYVKKNKKTSKGVNVLFIWILSWVGEFGDFLDKWFRYQVGMAWANAGFGFVVFERYPTDRLRGEYPGPKWSIFPVEQYFPMPDLIILLDVSEEDSLARKYTDGHSYHEMHEKRNNYLNLIKEIDPSMVLSHKASLGDVQTKISEAIWKYSVIKQSEGKNSVKLPAKWNPRYRDRLPTERGKQKEGFF